MQGEDVNQRIATAYFCRNRDPRYVATDLEQIAELGVTDLVLLETELDHLYFADSCRTIIDLAHQHHLRVLVDPWGWGGIICSRLSLFPVLHPTGCQETELDGRSALLPMACPNKPETLDTFQQWIEEMARWGADGVFLDEPRPLPDDRVEPDPLTGELSRLDPPRGWACHCAACHKLAEEQRIPLPSITAASLRHLVTHIAAAAHAAGLTTTLCLLAPLGRQEWNHWPELVAIPGVDRISTGAYGYALPNSTSTSLAIPADLTTYVQWFGRQLQCLSQTYALPQAPQLWIQAFAVPAGREPDLQAAALAAAECGISDIGIWTERWGTGDNNRSPNSEAVWLETVRTFHTLCLV